MIESSSIPDGDRSLPTVDVLTFGETMASIRTTRPLRLGGAMSMSLGGAETNVAIGLSRLGHSVRWAGRLGDDDVGQFAFRTLRAENVLTDTVVVDHARPTGLMLLESRGSGVSRASYYRSGSAGSALNSGDLQTSVDAGCRILHITGITAALSETASRAVLDTVRQARTAGALISLDVNYRSALWSADTAAATLTRLVSMTDVVIASEDELPLVTPHGLDEEERVLHLAGLGVQDVVIKRGARGATAWTMADGGLTATEQLDALPVTVVDVVGAGDAFSAGYLSAVLDGLPLRGRVARGVALGAFAVADPTDWEGLPTRRDLDAATLPSGTTLR